MLQSLELRAMSITWHILPVGGIEVTSLIWEQPSGPVAMWASGLRAEGLAVAASPCFRSMQRCCEAHRCVDRHLNLVSFPKLGPITPVSSIYPKPWVLMPDIESLDTLHLATFDPWGSWGIQSLKLSRPLDPQTETRKPNPKLQRPKPQAIPADRFRSVWLIKAIGHMDVNLASEAVHAIVEV